MRGYIEANLYIGADGNTYATNDLVAVARRKYIGLPEEFLKANFENYVTDCPERQRMRAGVANWIDDLMAGRTWRTGLMLFGPTGIGKTHLGVAAVKRAIHHYSEPTFIDYRRLVEECRESNRNYTDVVEYYANLGMLMIDEFGAIEPNKPQLQRINSILVERMNNRRPTIITTNLFYPTDFIQVKGGVQRAHPMDDRLISRIDQKYHLIYEGEAPDWRRDHEG